jgi:PAS domain S-box-containing protein
MKLSVENKIRVGFGSALAFLLLTSGAAFWSATRSIDNFRSVEHSELILRQLSEVLTAMVDIETGARGFALTGQDQFLEPFDDGRERAMIALKNLRESTSGQSEQQRNLNALGSLVDQRLAEAARLVNTRKAEGLEAAVRAADGAGKTMMDSIRRNVFEMEMEERQVLQRRSADAQATFLTTIGIIIASGLLAVIVVGIASRMAHRDFARRRAAEEQRDRFFDLSRDLLCFAGLDGFFKELNPAWESALGFSRAELKSRPFVEFIHPDDRAESMARVEKLAKGEEVIYFENRIRTRDNSYRWLSWNARASLPQNLIYATGRDITDQKAAAAEIGKLNAELQEHAKELESVNDELEAFSYSVSHDLRAPLRHINGFVDRLQHSARAQLDDKGRRYLDIIADSARQMGNLIDDLLVFSRMGRSEMQRTRVDLEALSREILNTCREEAGPRKITWRNGGLPEVDGDPSMLKQVMMNLISNAVKYTRPRAEAEIEIGSMDTPNEVVVFVRDNGVGFEMEYAHKLFGVFQRLHRSDEFEGTGIGLANVRRIIHRHGGRTWAEGKVNMGATFYFSLPKNRKEHRESPQTHPARGGQ